MSETIQLAMIYNGRKFPLPVKGNENTIWDKMARHCGYKNHKEHMRIIDKRSRDYKSQFIIMS